MVLPAQGAPEAEPATRHLGACLRAPTGSTVRAPLAASVRDRADLRLILAAEGFDGVLEGVEPAVDVGAQVEPGTVLGRLGAAPGEPNHNGADTANLRVVVVAPGLPPPVCVTATAWPGWDRLSTDPSTAFDLGRVLEAAETEPQPATSDLSGGQPGEPPGGPPAEPPIPHDAAAMLDHRRTRVLGRAQKRYYDTPPWITHGRGALLYDVEGRGYLDMINNVTVLGHAHPAITEAVRAQLDRLNTNSRFLYEPLIAFAERLAARLPAGLDQVFVVTSGSEATELALRLARHTTGRRDVLYLDDGYHGWTAAAASVSGELDEVASPVLSGSDISHPLLPPQPLPGPYRGPDATERYLDAAVAVIDRLVAADRPPACLIAETLLGNAGGIALPAGYLDRVYAAVRRVGGLCIADEVQVGYGRLGSHFWGFESQRVIPDIVTVAKAAGNGVPIGAVVTTRDIADAYADSAYFFSSAGGSPVSCAAGIAVLDTIEREGLQEAALRVGTHLKQRLAELRTSADDGPVRIGAVHGQGLYLGVELVRDLDSLEPAGAEAHAVCERLLTLGVIDQPTSRHGNVLKVKPPLCLTEAQADAFVDRLAVALTDGW